MSQNENKATQTENDKIEEQLQQLEKSMSALTKQQQTTQLPAQPQQQIQKPNNYNIPPEIHNKMQQLQEIDKRINELNQVLSSNQNLTDDQKNAAKAELEKLYKDGNRLCAEIDQHSQRYQAQLNNSLQKQPFNGVVDINTPQGQKLLAMIQAKDPRIKAKPVPGTNLIQLTFDDKEMCEINNKQPVKRVYSKIDKEQDDSLWEYVVGGFIILMTLLTCVLAFVNLDKQVNEIKKPKEEAVKPEEKNKTEETPKTTEQRDSGEVEVKEKICVATTEQKVDANGTLYGNCDPKKTDVKGVELTNDAKQALNTVSNPHDAYTITNSNGTKQTAYSISGTSDGQIHWRDANGKIYHADKDTISITNNNGHTLSDGSENIICNLTYQQQGKTNVVDWYYNSTTKIEHNPSTGNVIDITYQNNNSTWGTTGITQSQIGVADSISALPLATLQRASQQANVGNTFFAPFKVDGTTLQVNDLTTNYTYGNGTCIGAYDSEKGFVSNIGENNDLRQAIETESRVLANDSKLRYQDANGKTKTLQDNVFGYEVKNGKITIKYDYNEDKGTYSTKTYNLTDYSNINIGSDNANSSVSNSQLNLANNVQKYIDPNSGKTYVYADGLKATATGKYGDNNYTTNFTLGSAETSLSNLNADDIRNNETLTNMYNNNNKLYNYIRLNEGYDTSKFTTNSINNYNQLSNLSSLCNCRSY